ncbi:alanine racemase [Nesterenkonia cremea]|nr:alanine racemase [Nesterenkonia cremea]
MYDIRDKVTADRAGIDPLSKSHLGEHLPGDTVEIREQLPTPMLTWDTDSLVSNITEMARWAAEKRVLLAPHGKTTMTPDLWKAQLATGAVGITVANAAQARVAAAHQVPLIIVGNEFLTPPGLRWLRDITAAPGPEVMCWVDSLEAVELMGQALAGTGRPVQVCVELGIPGRRAGVRDDAQISPIVHAIREADGLSFAGFSGFEGVLPKERVDEVRSFLERMGALLERFVQEIETETPVVTAGGGLYFDLVAEVLTPVAQRCGDARVIVRSGAYLLHDHLHYERLTPRVTRGDGPSLTPAAILWTRVLSRPEEDLAILDAGKRDFAYDITLPRPLRVHRADGTVEELAKAEIFDSNDQHGYLRCHGEGLQVGDLVELGQAHPCTIADKWRDILLVTRTSPHQLRWDAVLRTCF